MQSLSSYPSRASRANTRPSSASPRIPKEGASEREEKERVGVGDSCGRLLRAANRLVIPKKKGPRAPQLKRNRAV